VECPSCKKVLQLKTLQYTHICGQSFDIQERLANIKRRQICIREEKALLPSEEILNNTISPPPHERDNLDIVLYSTTKEDKFARLVGESLLRGPPMQSWIPGR
jgi:hypothetical protein